MQGTRYVLEVQPRIPERIERLAELADDLFYSWDRGVRGLFRRLDSALWDACNHNPKVFLRRVAQKRLEEAAQDRVFLEDYRRVLSAYETYLQEQVQSDVGLLFDPQRDLVAYFCAEFGFHESLPVYSGGLGILAGDHCKAASDLGLPFVAVGLLYRQGYFTQTIDAHGNQVAHYHPTDFGDLPLHPATDAEGRELCIRVELPGRTVCVRVWTGRAGRIRVVFLDTDLPQNSEADRRITYQLYGGDENTRIQQEIVLGIGGVRALRALGLTPTVWHLNEGHAAFAVLERCREQVEAGLDFDAALELVAAGTVFTTHTPVPAGHDVFDHGLFRGYFEDFAARLGIPMDRLLALGASPANQGGFNMTALALRGSRFHNGVSRIHGRVASSMEGYVWPQIPHEENPIGHVTNGIHLPTFLARQWAGLFDMHFGAEWRSELLDEAYWQRIDSIPDYTFWSTHQLLKAELLAELGERVRAQHRRNGLSEAHIRRLTRHLNPDRTDILLLGFARRFATYKRATLLFQDPARLARILKDPERPAVIVFAGKAHPRDLPGQELIRTIHEYAMRPEFEGHIVLVENYDLALARALVTGVDVWVNTPEHPLEASGTSGMKAGVNGVLNLSVLDGWWAEGFDGTNGWGITPHAPHYDLAHRNREEGQELLDLLEEEVVPLYYHRDGHGYSPGWVRMAKASMRTLIPRFNAQRMVMDYVLQHYGPANLQARTLAEDGAAPARELAAWKARVIAAWPKVRARRLDPPPARLYNGEVLPIRVAVDLAGLAPEDVVVECLIGTERADGTVETRQRFPFRPLEERTEEGEAVYALDLTPTLPGLQVYRLRLHPYHRLMSHPLELGCMLWL
ncbi:alpha-glucan family phosphorylase [Inmirania thermothiophila]|uniref:Starch phosphorylase n=1 Tax=Inmirania thermothiophila TaxID=1750597 RepID=A0A3N1Y2P5_9GAMM|nr:alpha-glucan family phosphorylase [Inmirania thermothiophila]ROR32811.1 starch phosphorylase [Inmirania thermothiophila]